jgi:hypothetical protein
LLEKFGFRKCKVRDHIETKSEVVDWTKATSQDTVQCQAVLITVMNIRITRKARNFVITFGSQ